MNDYAHVLSPEQHNRIREFLLDEEKKTSNQIVILTINSLDGEESKVMPTKVFHELEAWPERQRQWRAFGRGH